jgi:WD repeat-containing protein 35
LRTFNDLQVSHDPICAVTASDKLLVIGRDTGLIHRYLLPEIKLDGKYTLKCRPQALALNNISSRLSIIDVSGVLTILDLDSKSKTPTKVETPLKRVLILGTK